MSELRLQPHGAALRFAVHVQPRSSRNEIAGLHGSALKVRLSAPPVDGAANEALIVMLARELGVPPRQLRIVSGAAARTKTVEVHGVDRAAVERLATP